MDNFRLVVDVIVAIVAVAQVIFIARKNWPVLTTITVVAVILLAFQWPNDKSSLVIELILLVLFVAGWLQDKKSK